MIKLEDLTPKVYYTMSRDFQLLGRLYDLVLNSVNVDTQLLYYLPLGINSNINTMDLLASTLGFVPRHKYNAKQLKAVCSVLPTIIKNKGSVKSVITLANTILHAEGISDSLEYSFNYSTQTLELMLPPELTDLTLLLDVMEYILPAGVNYAITHALPLTIPVETELDFDDNVTIYSQNNQLDTDLISYSRLVDLSEIDQNAISKADLTNEFGRSAHITTLSLDNQPIVTDTTDETEENSNE